jgi:hypothetical protein
MKTSAFGVEHEVISKETGFMPMGPRKKANPAKLEALKAGYRSRAARQAGTLARIGRTAARVR